ncbi:MAG: MFS transporter, partial [Polyangiaceae bacterium]|nr:MFS transporter [Polyangiaceae bacterium]
VQVGAQRAGIIGGGGGILAIIDTIGYREAFFLMAFMLALLTLPVLGLREPARAPRPRTPHTSIARSSAELIRSFLERPDARSVLRLLFLFKVGDALAAGMVSRWYVKQGLSNAQIALTRGTAGGVAAIAGAAAGGLALRAFGARRALFATASLQTCAIAMYLVADIFHPSGAGTMKMAVYTGLSIVEHALGGAATAALFAWMMDHCREESRATDYTVQACLLVVVTGIGIFTSGFIVGAIGLRGLFATATLLGLLAPIAVVSYARSDGARVGAGL